MSVMVIDPRLLSVTIIQICKSGVIVLVKSLVVKIEYAIQAQRFVNEKR